MPRKLLRTQLVASCVCVLVVGLNATASAQTDPNLLLKEADRLAWLRAWGAAEGRYAEAERLFTDGGETRNALYARISVLRGQLPRLPAAEVSARLAEYLEHPLVQSDHELRLRCLVIKGETDADLDPTLAAGSWREAEALATKLGDAPWANRARGELGMLAFLQGDIGASVIGLGQALKVAQSNGDVSSQVRWLTLFGLGYVQLGRPQEALDFYDRALTLDVFLFRAVCGNHLIWGFQHVAGFRRRHVGASIQEAWTHSLSSVRAALDADPAHDRAMVLRATTREIAPTRDGVLDAVVQRLDLPQKQAAEAYTVAEAHEANPRSVWGYVQGLTRLSQRTPWQDGRFTLDRAASRLLTTVQ